MARAQPANDDFASATVIQGLPFTDGPFSTAGATDQGNEQGPCGAIGSTVWYAFTPSVDHRVQADTIGSDYLTVLAAYAGTSLLDLTLITCNDDDFRGSPTRIEFMAVAGATVFIQVGGILGATGMLTFHMTGAAIPINDDFANAWHFEASPFRDGPIITHAASNERDEPSPCGSVGNTVWYWAIATSDGPIRASTEGSDFNTVLAAYTGFGLGFLTLVACDDDSSGLQSSIEFAGTPGVEYHFQVGGAGGATGSLMFHATGVGSDTISPTITCPGDVAVTATGTLTAVDIGSASAADNSGTVTITNDAPEGLVFPIGTTTVTWTATDGSLNTASCAQSVTVRELPYSAVTNSRLCRFDADPDLLGQQFRLAFRERHHDDDDDDDDDDRDEARSYRLRSSSPHRFVYNVFYFGTPGTSVALNIHVPYPFVTRGSDPIRVYDGARLEFGCFVPSDPIAGFTSTGTRSVTSKGDSRITLRDFGCRPTPPAPIASCRGVTITVSGTVPASGVVYVALRLDYGLEGREGFGRNDQNDATAWRTGAVLIPNLGSYAFGVSGAVEDTQTIQNENTFQSRRSDDD